MRSRDVVVYAVATVVGISVIAAISSGGSDKAPTPASTATPVPPESVLDVPVPPESVLDVEPEPTREVEDASGETELDCAYELGDFGESGDPRKGYRFVAGGTIKASGNVGIRVRVTYKWKRLGQGALVVHKVYRVRRGETRDVNITVPVSQDDLSAHQNADGDCTAKGTVVASIGLPPLK